TDSRAHLRIAHRQPDLHAVRVRPASSGERPREATFHTLSTTTPAACSASAHRSPASEVSTTPPGSAATTTRASTADPRRAWALGAAGRRASACGPNSAISQVLRNRFVAASLPGCPVRHSTSTAEGTNAGHNPSRRSAASNATAARERCARKLTPPESSTSIPNCLPPARLPPATAGTPASLGRRLPTGALPAPARDRLGARHLLRRRRADLGDQFIEVGVGVREQVLAAHLRTHRLLQELRGRQAAGLDLVIEIVWQVDLQPRHTPNY